MEIYRQLRTLYETVLERPAPAGGSEAAIANAERRLGRQLPASLRAFYALFDDNDPVFRKNYHISSLDRLRNVGGHLHFCTDSQAGMSFGVDLASLDFPDPPVYWVWASQEDEGWKWEEHYDELSACLVAFVCFNLHLCLKQRGIVNNVDQPEYGAIIQELASIKIADTGPFGGQCLPYYKAGLLICHDAVSRKAFIGCQSVDMLTAFPGGADLKVDWGVCLS